MIHTYKATNFLVQSAAGAQLMKRLVEKLISSGEYVDLGTGELAGRLTIQAFEEEQAKFGAWLDVRCPRCGQRKSEWCDRGCARWTWNCPFFTDYKNAGAKISVDWTALAWAVGIAGMVAAIIVTGYQIMWGE